MQWHPEHLETEKPLFDELSSVLQQGPCCLGTSLAHGRNWQRSTTSNGDRWTLEVYRTIIETLQSIAWMLLVFFGFALVGYVIVRGFEFLRSRKPSGQTETAHGSVQEVGVNGLDVAALH